LPPNTFRQLSCQAHYTTLEQDNCFPPFIGSNLSSVSRLRRADMRREMEIFLFRELFVIGISK
jgi:hypothetical protein